VNQEQAQRKKAPNHAETDARHQHVEGLGDFTTTLRVLAISGLAIVIGAVCAVLALLLLRLIGLFTNLFYFGRWSTTMVSPVGNHLGIYAVFVPVVGALVIGVMARYGSERIRGHGIPEAIEAILINGSRVEAKVAILKPISSAISIGSGGPFGAEGPIIMTGGAFGSLIAQLFHLASAERKTLLVAGAAGGMSATFASPVAAVLLADNVLGKRLQEIMRPHTIEVYPDEPLRAAVYRMAEKGVTRMPVVERESRQLLGLISLDDLLKARPRHLEEERRRERTIQVQNYFPGNRSNRKPPEVQTSA
jgi:CBS domain-containing protein